MQIVPIATILLAAALLWLGGRLARRQAKTEAVGLSFVLCLLALGLALIPSNWQVWLASGEAGDHALSLLRGAGVAGLAFLAGTRFNAQEVWKAPRIALLAAASVLLAALTVIVLTGLGAIDRAAAITAVAASAGTSLWLSVGGQSAPGKETIAAAVGTSVVLTALSLLTVHLFAAFHELAGRPLSSSAYTIVALYELTKISVCFSLAYFVASGFLTRAQRVSSARALIGYLLIVLLIFALANSFIGQLAGVAWAFVAGALLIRSEGGKRLLGADQSIAVALLTSFAFLPLVLQPHGRVLPNKTLVFFTVGVALLGKFAAVWMGARVGGAASAEAKRIAVATLAAGEAGIAILGFGLTQWVIEGPLYFGILAYVFASLLLSAVWPSPAHSSAEAVTQDGSGQPPSARGQRSVMRRKQTLAASVAIGAGLLGLATVAHAQAAATAREDDPAARALERIRGIVDERAAAASRVLAASKLLSESAEAKKQGKQEQAQETLAQAEKIVAETGGMQTDGLAEALLRRVAAERETLAAKPAAVAFQAPPRVRFNSAQPKLVRARDGQYQETLTRILAEENVPPELLAVAIVESRLNPLALSPKGARGIWQFMPATAERYGLTVQPLNDQRTHPEHSTRAAARYLRDLYRQFGDWKLAFAAYNAGETRVQQIIDRTGIRAFDELARRGLLPLETRKYVPAVLAAWSQLAGATMPTAPLSQTAGLKKTARRQGLYLEALRRPTGLAATAAEQ